VSNELRSCQPTGHCRSRVCRAAGRAGSKIRLRASLERGPRIAHLRDAGRPVRSVLSPNSRSLKLAKGSEGGQCDDARNGDRPGISHLPRFPIDWNHM